MRIRLFALPAVAAATLAVAGCGGASDTKDSGDAGGSASGGSGAQLSLVAYSTPQVVYDELIPAFQKTEAGAGTRFKTSFGASGDQSRAVEAGLEADVVSFSVEPDMTRLQKAGLVDRFQKVSTSVVAFTVRKGNPKGIKGWDDLLKPGVEVITPNPFMSGAAKWNLLGAYAHGGLDFVKQLIEDHVPVQPKSGREALQTFTGGEGDVLLSYEYETVTAQKKGEDVDLVVPDDTLQIDILGATTKGAPPAARTFLDYVVSDEGQKHFDAWGYDPPSGPQTKVGELKTIEDLGGWSKVNDALFDPEKGSIAKIEEDAGVSTAK
ncbi:extracellular solute-binding protein [Conexibacter sp. SYSU D00693]|uniref:extracellular solute-binding protein n=1 Tax=Conexibacter sp. SYSU D00693 TaxID=2812560 RepID=UPI00196A38A8|nr:extracellular solute-binding protein [Conexibacter sp. SYSU D00693]